MHKEKVIKLIKQAAEYLSEAELLEEHGWSEEDKEMLDYIANNDFDIQFK